MSHEDEGQYVCLRIQDIQRVSEMINEEISYRELAITMGELKYKCSCRAINLWPLSDIQTAKKLEWIACTDRMPDAGADCLVVNCWSDEANYIGTSVWRSEVDGWEEYAIDEVSHWMYMDSLPEVPRADPA